MEDRTISNFNSILKQYYDYDGLKPEQYEIINYILEGYDCIAMLHTGFGKSLIFIMIYLITKKNVIVISPLISLMNDQIDKLINLKINAYVFNSTVDLKKLNKIKRELNENTGLIYTTPEYFIKEQLFFRELNNVACLTIDECHCISSFGLSFRPSYLELHKIKEILVDVPILCVSGTISQKVKEDIIKTLKLKKYKIITGSFNRKNLFVQIERNNFQTFDKIVDIIKAHKNERIIIYALTRALTESISNKLNGLSFKTNSYHAGMADDDRLRIQNQFRDNEINIIVSTTSFGLGIDLDIKVVINYNCPNNIEMYIQMIGRCARTGGHGECYLFWTPKDMELNRFFIKDYKKEEKIYQEEQIRLMEKFVNTSECRKKIALSFLNEHIEDCKTMCDNCICKKDIIMHNYFKQTYLICSLLRKYDGRFGSGQFIKILIGRKVKEDFMELDEYNQGIVFGKEDYWKSIFEILKLNDFIQSVQMKTGFGSTIKLSTKALKWLNEIKKKYPIYNTILSDLNCNSTLMFQEIEQNIKVKQIKIKK